MAKFAINQEVLVVHPSTNFHNAQLVRGRITDITGNPLYPILTVQCQFGGRTSVAKFDCWGHDTVGSWVLFREGDLQSLLTESQKEV